MGYLLSTIILYTLCLPPYTSDISPPSLSLSLSPSPSLSHTHAHTHANTCTHTHASDDGNLSLWSQDRRQEKFEERIQSPCFLRTWHQIMVNISASFMMSERLISSFFLTTVLAIISIANEQGGDGFLSSIMYRSSENKCVNSVSTRHLYIQDWQHSATTIRNGTAASTRVLSLTSTITNN